MDMCHQSGLLRTTCTHNVCQEFRRITTKIITNQWCSRLFLLSVLLSEYLNPVICSTQYKANSVQDMFIDTCPNLIEDLI